MKLFISILIFAQLVLNAKAQENLSFKQGTQTIHLGLGIGSGFTTGTVKTPPIQAHYDYGISEDLSIGGIIGYASSSYTYGSYTSHQSLDYSYLIIGARGNYHFSTTDKFDPYIGATLGYNKISFNDNGGYLGSDVLSSGILFAGQIGANYYFKPNIGAWAEVGYGIGVINLGITFKF